MKKSVIAIFLLIFAARLAAAKVELHVTPNQVEILGGGGAGAWKLVYGTSAEFQPKLLEVSLERAFFAQGGWVRLIDTKRGQVIGRWHIGPSIVGLKPAGEELAEVETLDTIRRTLAVGGTPPEVHDSIIVGPGMKVRLTPSEGLPHRTGQIEATRFLLPFYFGMPKLRPEQAREMLPAVEDMVRRDPLSPWARVTYAHLLQQANDARAAAAAESVLQSPGGDFSEWLPISAYFYRVRKDELAQTAYDRGYKDLLERGYDPRLIKSLFFRMGLFSLQSPGLQELFALPPEVVDRAYRVAPYPEYAWIVWHEYAKQLEQRGRPQDAQLWEMRSRDARQNAPSLIEYFGLSFDRAILFPSILFPAIVVFVLVVNRRYGPQHSVDVAAGRRQYAIPGISNLCYWSRGQRLALLILVLSGWAATGIAGMYADGFTRAEFAPATPMSGTYFGPFVRWHFQSLPASPERDLLLAMSYQQSGDSRRAEEFYRKLPQFAESWNNLGVILKRRGHDEDARQAFQHALQLNPQLHEAAFNLDSSTPDLWTQLHKQYLPDRPMLAIPRPQELQAAYRGGSALSVYMWNAMRGPFWSVNAYFIPGFILRSSPYGAFRIGTELLWIAALLFALVMVGVVRRQKVTEGPTRSQWIAELVFPGTLPRWSALGGLVLGGWLICWLAIFLYATQHSPWLITPDAMWLLRWYTRRPQSGLALLNPSWLWFAVPAAVIFGVNFLLVRRAKAGSPRTTATAA